MTFLFKFDSTRKHEKTLSRPTKTRVAVFTHPESLAANEVFFGREGWFSQSRRWSSVFCSFQRIIWRQISRHEEGPDRCPLGLGQPQPEKDAHCSLFCACACKHWPLERTRRVDWTQLTCFHKQHCCSTMAVTVTLFGGQTNPSKMYDDSPFICIAMASNVRPIANTIRQDVDTVH